MCIIHIKGITFTRNIKKNCCFKSQHTVKTLWNAITNFSTQARELLRLPSWYKWPLLFVFSSARSQLLGRLTGSSRVQSPRLCRQLLDAVASHWAADRSGERSGRACFSTARAPFWTSWTWNLSVLIPMCCFTAARSEVTTGWRVLTARKRRRRKRNSGMSAPSYVVKVTFSAFVWFTCVCVCVLSPKRAENCKLSLEHQCYKRDTFKKQPWHGCLFPDDSQWHIHFLTNTWTKYLPPLELQRLAALCFLCRAP